MLPFLRLPGNKKLLVVLVTALVVLVGLLSGTFQGRCFVKTMWREVRPLSGGYYVGVPKAVTHIRNAEFDFYSYHAEQHGEKPRYLTMRELLDRPMVMRQDRFSEVAPGSAIYRDDDPGCPFLYKVVLSYGGEGGRVAHWAAYCWPRERQCRCDWDARIFYVSDHVPYEKGFVAGGDKIAAYTLQTDRFYGVDHPPPDDLLPVSITSNELVQLGWQPVEEYATYGAK